MSHMLVIMQYTLWACYVQGKVEKKTEKKNKKKIKNYSRTNLLGEIEKVNEK